MYSPQMPNTEDVAYGIPGATGCIVLASYAERPAHHNGGKLDAVTAVARGGARLARRLGGRVGSEPARPARTRTRLGARGICPRHRAAPPFGVRL